MHRLLSGIALIVAAAMLAVGVDRVTANRFAAVPLREDHATLVLIAAWSMLLGIILARRQPVMGAVLQALSAGLAALAASADHWYLYAFAAAALATALLTALLPRYFPASAPAGPMPAPQELFLLPELDDDALVPFRREAVWRHMGHRARRHRAISAPRHRQRRPGAPIPNPLRAGIRRTSSGHLEPLDQTADREAAAETAVADPSEGDA